MSQSTNPTPDEPGPIPIETENRRILLIDDTQSIHEDFRKILAPTSSANPELDDLMASVFGETPAPPKANPPAGFELDSALQGQEALEKVRAACAAGKPYAVAFVDIRMPPGWDGVETLLRLWKEDPALQAVICTAFSDYSWDQIAAKLGRSDCLLILKKPFDPAEVLQLAHAMTKKWNLSQQAATTLGELQLMVEECTTTMRQRLAELHREIGDHVRAEDRLLKAFNASPLPMAIIRSEDLCCVDANRSFLAVTGCTRDAALRGDLTALGIAPGADMIAALKSGDPIVGRDCTVSLHGAEPRAVRLWSEPLTLTGEQHTLIVIEGLAGRASAAV